MLFENRTKENLLINCDKSVLTQKYSALNINARISQFRIFLSKERL